MTTSLLKYLNPIGGDYNLSNYQKVCGEFSWEEARKHFSWYQTNKVNMAYECIDRHVADGFGEKTAIHYVNGEEEIKYSFKEVKEKTDHLATVLKKHGIHKGDIVFVFLPKHPDCLIATLAVIKLGAIVGPLFEAFMEEAIKDRISDCEGRYLITNLELGIRVPRDELPTLKKIFYTEDVDQCLNGEISLVDALRNTEIDDNVLEWVDFEHGLNIHYTSGSTGKPKGIIHAHRAMVHQYLTGKWVLDLKEDDVYWCTAHPGWVTGTVYGIFAPWLNRATIVINGGRFDAHSWYRAIERTKPTVWYSAPTAFRMLMAEGNDLVREYDLSSLRHLLSVGEPLNPEVIYWGQEVLGKRIHDTWWMTETGAQLIVNLPSEVIKPGSMGRAFPGIEIAVLDDDGERLQPGEVGHLAVKAPWPGIMKEVWRNKEKYDSYFKFNGWYISGDLATIDEDGYIFFQGRSDDMINSSGERIGPFEVESKLIEHPAVAEAGVIGKPDPLRGEIVKAFIVLRKGYEASAYLIEEIRLFVRQKLAAHSAPREIEILDELPKTKISGKILRRELKRIELQRLGE
ncbi:acetate--CoA ligase [Schinkia azotoformans]|uniref:acetate--CoA ligase n=1 Tax=Schinkia azotoformans TaxID=1454 RepID=UPI002DBC4406|nr:acetate--CoA ligase [Schinkia azotoformans]MEC1716078.1 acetate--CoA ligase [Schinkia azotoformans]MEC1740549.1 acetate--CoA ligase [Schinkia azotoformans]MEC1756117.1 acetate--CoA ligase [Schinkia azotoformans]MEC1768846.1 acetate--CoA ligase [Schinkia azotoformans]MEC1788402.1 acetate--CoA ligase [Schinkia azotoformans]